MSGSGWVEDEELGGRLGTARILSRGVQEAPRLRQGIGRTIAYALVGAAGRVVIPITVQQAIDHGFTTAGVRMGFVTVLCAIAAGSVILGAIAQRAAVRRLGRRSEGALYDLRVRVIAHIHRLSLADHSDERRGALVARVTSDVETLAEFFQWGGLAWLLDGALMLIVAAVMLSYDWVLALIAFVVGLPLVWVLRFVQRFLAAAYDRARARNADLLGSVTEVVTGAETLRAYGAGPIMAERTKVIAKQRADAFVRAGTIGAFLFPSGEVFSALTVAAVVGVGVARGPGGGMSAGALVGFVFLTYRFLEPIAEFTEVLDQTQTAVAGLRRLLGILDLPIGPLQADSPRALPEGPLSIHVNDVTFRYRSRDVLESGGGDDEPVLIGVSAIIPAGQQVALVGSTGSGKTTLGRLLARFADPLVGQIALGGVPLTFVANDELRKRLVVVPQEPFLFDDTIAANLGFALPGTSLPDLERAVTALDLDEWLATMPEGLQTPVGERGSQLSAGERQLVALLRASVADPDVLILDEATSSVDALTEVRMSRALERLAEGRTTISIAHRLSTAMRADRVLVLEHGRLIEDGHHDELVAAGGRYAELFTAWVSSTST
ncbi:MAG: putative transporter permease/ATP-binding protein [Ilumatobacteraceae bacterium]|nr:putative transporter permease/ATP-binding protein [Ilumatobacteraceae bacterium]